MLADLAMFGRFCAGLRGFFRTPVSVVQARALLRHGNATRAQRFLTILERAVYGQTGSPYLRLLEWAGVELGDVRGLVEKQGLEGALERLKTAGVYVTLDEFKGRKPIRRPGLEVVVRPEDFDNPLLTRHFHAVTGGSGGVRRRLIIDLGLLEHDAAALRMVLEGFQIVQRPLAVWRPVPPGAAGIKRALLQEKMGLAVARWFSQSDPRIGAAPLKSWMFLTAAVAGSRLWGQGLPSPEYVRLDQASLVARWLGRQHATGHPGHLDTNVSSAVRACQAARDEGIDISGTFVRVGGEPLTPQRAELFRAAGCRVACNYSMSETGPIGVACADPASADDVHVLGSKIAVVRSDAAYPNALYLTSLLFSSPRLLLNVESGDAAGRQLRSCSCPLGELGFNEHLSDIRSYEKLTSEGMQFLPAEITELVESVLPQSFGGNATDYQLVEEDVDGLPRVSVAVHPRLGQLDETAVVNCVLERLAAPSAANRMMAERLRQASTLRVIRRPPFATSASKILALHVRR
jgi:hypothetical protein